MYSTRACLEHGKTESLWPTRIKTALTHVDKHGLRRMDLDLHRHQNRVLAAMKQEEHQNSNNRVIPRQRRATESPLPLRRVSSSGRIGLVGVNFARTARVYEASIYASFACSSTVGFNFMYNLRLEAAEPL